jgi:putative PIN family toxin of toxin-antitoxin system
MVKLVLDTNVVLDWLVFDDPYMKPLRDGVRDQTVTLISYPPAFDELQRVLGYKQLKLNAPRQAEVLAAYQASTVIPLLPKEFSLQSLLLPAGFPRCRDSDDQHFLAVAFHSQADALVSRDKAVLKLVKRAAKFGVRILDVPQLIASL